MEKIAEFCRRGGIVIATLRLPEYAYGWKNREENTARLKSLVAQMFGERSAAQEVAENSFGSGKAIFVADETTNFAKALQRALPGDILFQPVDPWVTFVHRHTPNHDFYFVCNMSRERKSVRATFRVGHGQPGAPRSGRSPPREQCIRGRKGGKTRHLFCGDGQGPPGEACRESAASLADGRTVASFGRGPGAA